MKRIQRKRTKGWKMTDNTVYVGRPTKFGNPFRLTPDGWIESYSTARHILDPWILWSGHGGWELSDIIDLYKMWLTEDLQKRYKFLPIPPDISELKGKDLACWCPPDKPCHVDVLIELLT